MAKKEAVAHTDTAASLPREVLPLAIEELTSRRVNWKKCTDSNLLEEVATQGDILTLIGKETSEFKEQVYSNGYNHRPAEAVEEEEDVCLEALEAEVTEMHTRTMTRLPEDNEFLAQLALMRADAAAASEEEDD